MCDSAFLQPQVTLLADDTSQSEVKPKLISNINGCMALADVVRTIHGPRGGMGKFINDGKGGYITISNDGATINIVHMAARLLVLIGKCDASVVGDDAATTVVLLAAEFLKEAKPLVENNVHPQHLIRCYQKASSLAIKRIEELALSIEQGKSLEEKILLAKFASTTLSSKLIGGEKKFLATMVVDAVLAIGNEDRLDMIGVKKLPGGTIRESFLMNGVVFKKTFSYAGMEYQPKKFFNPKILLLNMGLEIKSAKENEEMRLSDPLQYQSIVDAEWNIITDRLDKCVKSGAKIVLSQLPIDHLGTLYLAARDIFSAGSVSEEDVHRVAAASGGTVQTTLNNIIDEVLDSCDVFEEQQFGNEQFTVFSGCSSGPTATIVLRGDADEEAERSLHDTIMAVRRVVKSSAVVAGGGAIDMEISRHLMQHVHIIAGKSHDALPIINSYAKALEVIPRQLCDNAGFDATDVLNKLRQKHVFPSGESASYGVDVNTGGIADSFANFVWEPADVKKFIIKSATLALCLMLSVGATDDTPKFKTHRDRYAGGRGRGRGYSRRGMRRIRLCGLFNSLLSIFFTVLLLGRFPIVSGLMCFFFVASWGLLVKSTIKRVTRGAYTTSSVDVNAINPKCDSAKGDGVDVGVIGGGRRRGRGAHGGGRGMRRR